MLTALEESLRAWLTPLIAIIALWIAYQQHKNTKTKIKLDLFDRRIAMYESAQAFMGTIIRDGAVDQERLIRFRQDCWHSRFLFGADVNEEFDTIFEHANKLSTVIRQIRADVWQGCEIERDQALRKESELLLWITERGKHLDKVMEPYLNFSEVKT